MIFMEVIVWVGGWGGGQLIHRVFQVMRLTQMVFMGVGVGHWGQRVRRGVRRVGGSGGGGGGGMGVGMGMR